MVPLLSRVARFTQTEKQSAATQRSVTADCELLQSYCRLLFHHGTSGYLAGGGTQKLNLVSASADHEMEAMPIRQSHDAGTVRIHGICPVEIQIPIITEYKAVTEVEDQKCRASACAIKRKQANRVFWRIDAYGPQYGWWVEAVLWSKPRTRAGVTAVEATQIIGLGARQGNLHD